MVATLRSSGVRSSLPRVGSATCTSSVAFCSTDDLETSDPLLRFACNREEQITLLPMPLLLLSVSLSYTYIAVIFMQLQHLFLSDRVTYLRSPLWTSLRQPTLTKMELSTTRISTQYVGISIPEIIIIII